MQLKEEYTMKNQSKQILACLMVLVMLLAAAPAAETAGLLWSK